MTINEKYEAFRKENPNASQKEQGEFFAGLIQQGATQAEIVLAVEAANSGISHGAAKTRVSSCLRIYRESSTSVVDDGTTETIGAAESSGTSDVANATETKDASETITENDSAEVPAADSNAELVNGTEECNLPTLENAPAEKEVENRPYEDTLPSDFMAGIPLDELVSAPKKWNFFEPPNADAKANIIKSIHRYGLWNPITVWEQEDGTYMILGGHTRKAAFEYLYEHTGEDRYKTIPASVYAKDTLDDYEAERILILNNVAQRNHVPEKLRPRCFGKLVELEKQKSFYGSGIDVKEAVAKASGTSRTTVFNYLNLEDLIPELLELYTTGELPMTKGVIISKLAEDLQRHIYENCYYERPAKQLKELKDANSIEEIDSKLQEAEMPSSSRNYTVKTSVERPEGFSTVGIHVAQGDLDRVKSLLRAALESAEDVSSETKAVALQMLA